MQASTPFGLLVGTPYVGYGSQRKGGAAWQKRCARASRDGRSVPTRRRQRPRPCTRLLEMIEVAVTRARARRRASGTIGDKRWLPSFLPSFLPSCSLTRRRRAAERLYMDLGSL